MKTLTTTIPDVSLVQPDPKRDAPFAVDWFAGPTGRETLLSMGNSERDIHPLTLQEETETLESFLELERIREQLIWMIRAGDKTIGAVWLDLIPKYSIQAPGLHIMIGDREYRGQGIGTAVMQAVIEYARNELGAEYVYSRNLVGNEQIKNVKRKLGWIADGEPYTDDDGLIWQNTKIHL